MSERNRHIVGYYVDRKVLHMQRFGIDAGYNGLGGALPRWRKEEREADDRRVARARVWRGYSRSDD